MIKAATLKVTAVYRHTFPVRPGGASFAGYQP
jgi:hypothetical protein